MTTTDEIVYDITSAGRLRPEPHELRRLLDTGRTYAQIAQLFAVQEGTVKSWVSRAGLATRRPRYHETIPWHVKGVHRSEYSVKMLRVLGRRLAGTPNTKADDQRLDSFLAKLHDTSPRLVIAYAPWRKPGFVTVPGRWVGGGKIPIQREEIPEPSSGDGGRHRKWMVVEQDPTTGTWAEISV